MSTRTIVIVSDDGRLINTSGTLKEADSHYKKFSDRLLGDNGSAAIINYGWNGKDKLTITGASGTGSQITLDASEVVIPATLKVGGSTLGQLLALSETKTLNGIRGTNGQIEVLVTPNPAAGTPGEPDNLCILSLSQAFMSRLDNLEAQVSGMLRFDDIYYAGDGIKVDHVNKRIGVRLGTGLTFEDVLPGSSSSDYGSGSDSPEEEEEEGSVKAIAVDLEGIIEAVEEAIAPLVVSKYVLDMDSSTGNVILYNNQNS